MSSFKHCTTPGYHAAEQLRKRLKGTICGPENAFTGTGNNSTTDGDLAELNTTRDEEGKAALRLHQINKFLVTHRPVPVPTKFDKAFVGTRVDFEYPDEHDKIKKGSLVLGGENEQELYKKQKILSVFYQSITGRAVLGKSVGDFFDYGRFSDAKITAIGLPPEPDPDEEATDSAQLALPLAKTG